MAISQLGGKLTRDGFPRLEDLFQRICIPSFVGVLLILENGFFVSEFFIHLHVMRVVILNIYLS